MNKSDIKLIIILFVFLLLICLIMYIFKDDRMKQAKVYYEDKVILTIDLSKNDTYSVDGYNGKVKFLVENHKIKVLEENSPKHICSYQGFISESYQTLVCLPNKIIVKIENNNSYDAIVR